MKVLMLNGSCNPKGCTYTALEEIGRTLAEEGVSYEIFQLGPAPIRDCIGCGQCEAICPQHLPIIENLKKVAAYFEGDGDKEA